MVFRFLQSSYQKVKSVLQKTGSLIGNRLREIFSGPVDEEKLEEIEQLLYEADLGVKTAMELTDKVRQMLRKNPELTAEECLAAMKRELLEMIDGHTYALKTPAPNGNPLVILVVGVNGNGKTTSIAKLSNLFLKQNQKVIVGAGDTFRAAAIEQLETWAERLGLDIVKGQPKADPAAVAYDTLQAAISRGSDVVLLDTAGRLHTKHHLMQELEKIHRTCSKVAPDTPDETLLVLDATTGQNAIDQAKIFHQHTPLTGLILTKLDGTAKGGIVLHIQRELGIPVKFIGLGEGVDDFEPFNPEQFVASLLD